MDPIEVRPLLHEATDKGEPIVLVPGGLSGWLPWIPFAEPLAKDRQVIRVQPRSAELAEAGTDVTCRTWSASSPSWPDTRLVLVTEQLDTDGTPREHYGCGGGRCRR